MEVDEFRQELYEFLEDLTASNGEDITFLHDIWDGPVYCAACGECSANAESIRHEDDCLVNRAKSLLACLRDS